MNCDEIKAKIDSIKNSILNRNARIAAHHYGLESNKADSVLDELHNKYGIDKEAARTFLSTVKGNDADGLKRLENADRVSDGAYLEWKKGETKDGTPPKEWVSDKMGMLRDKFRQMFEKAFNAIPIKGNRSLKDGLQSLAGEKQLIKLGGESTFAGSVKDQQLRIAVDEMFNKVGKQSGLNKKNFGEMLLARFAMRGHDPEQFMSDYRKIIKEAQPSYGKQAERMFGFVEQARKSDLVRSEVDSFMNKEYKNLDTARSYAIDKGILRAAVDKNGKELPAGRQDYTPNIISMREHTPPGETSPIPKEASISYFKKEKTYSNMFDTMLHGFMPASTDFNDIAGHYWKTYANAVRMPEFAETLKYNASLDASHPDKMTIVHNTDYSEPAVVSRALSQSQWKTPETADGKMYKELSSVLGGKFEGIYAHPDVYKWADRTFSDVKILPAGVLKANALSKGTLLRMGSLYHRWSLTRKAAYEAAATTEGGPVSKVSAGIRNFWETNTIVGEGLSTINNGKDFEILSKAIDNGFGMEGHDFINNASLSREYDIKTGDLTIRSKLNDAILRSTDWGHSNLFEKFRPGLKVGMLTRIVKSDYFTNLKRDLNGDEDMAYKQVSKMLNDHFGAQNLEAIGRSRVMQTILQASLLAPDWTESKMKRLFGAAVAQDPSVRRNYQMSLTAELATVLASRIAIQGIAGQINGNSRSLDEIAHDCWNGRLGSIWLGKIKVKQGGKWVEKDKWWNVFGSEDQDLRTVLMVAKGAYNAGSKQSVSELGEAAKSELRNRASPALRFLMHEKRPGEPDPSILESALPMAGQSAVRASRGELGGKTQDEITTDVIESLVSSVGGMPLTTTKVEKPKKDKTKKLVIMK